MEKSSFFNSVNGDRKYKAQEFAEYFSAFIGNGVFPNPSTNLQVFSSNDMTIVIKQGKAWVNGYFYVNTNDLILNISPADGLLNRIDRIVLRLDFTKREIKAVVKKGDFASNAVAKPLQRDADCYELALADITVIKGAISVTQSNITDLRLNKELCGIAKGTIEEVDTTTLFNQYNAKLGEKSIELENQFYDWFKTIQTHLEGDIAANLANKVAKLEDSLGKEELNTTKKEIKGAINELKSSMITSVNAKKKGDVILTASDIKNSEGKSIEIKLTELFQYASNGKNAIAGAVGNVSEKNSFGEIANYIASKRNEIGGYLGAGDYGNLQRLCDWAAQRKTDLANQLNSKGVGASNQENLGQLISKVAQVQTKGKVATGTSSITLENKNPSNATFIINNLDFKPSYLNLNLDKIPFRYSNQKQELRSVEFSPGIGGAKSFRFLDASTNDIVRVTATTELVNNNINVEFNFSINKNVDAWFYNTEIQVKWIAIE